MSRWRGKRILAELLPGMLTMPEICEACPDADRASVADSCRKLARRGLLTMSEGLVEITDRGRQCLADEVEITSGPGPDRPVRRAQTLRERAWRTMRLRRKFGVDDLLALAADGTEKDARADLRRYCRALESAGYLVRLRAGQMATARAAPTWILPDEQNTGPEAPRWNTGARRVTDPNTGTVVRLLTHRTETKENP